MERRNFLRRLAVGVAGLMVADDALELLLKPEPKIYTVGIDLSPRWNSLSGVDGKEWTMRHYTNNYAVKRPITTEEFTRVLHEVYADGIRNHLTTLHPLLRQFS